MADMPKVFEPLQCLCMSGRSRVIEHQKDVSPLIEITLPRGRKLVGQVGSYRIGRVAQGRCLALFG